MTPTRREFFAYSAAAVAPAAWSGTSAAHPTRPGVVRLPCGRRIAYTEHGNPSGPVVVVYHHGLPSARREAEVMVPALCRYPDVRLIAFDRPGVGDSDPVAAPSFCAWARDLITCLDALGVDRFSLTGTSGGAPYVFAVALACPGRVRRIALACPVAEHRHGRDNGADAWYLRLCGRAPRVARSILALGGRRVARNPEAVTRLFQITPAERVILRDSENLALVAGILTDSVKQGPAGPVAEGARLPGPWGLPLGEVTTPTALFHGTADPIAPCWMSLELGRAIPGATVRLYPGDGHLALPRNHAADVLAAAV